MTIRDYVFKIGDGIGHLASGLLALDSIHHIYQGNYEIAALEGIAAAYIQIEKVLERQRRKTIDTFVHRAETELIPLIKQTGESTHRSFQLASKV